MVLELGDTWLEVLPREFEKVESRKRTLEALNWRFWQMKTCNFDTAKIVILQNSKI